MTVSKEQLMTAEALLYRTDDGFRYELREGKLRRMPLREALRDAVSIEIATSLAVQVKQYRLGRVFGAGTGFRLTRSPDTVLAPDVSFVRTARIPQTGMPRGYFPGAPDLAVEVVSPGDTVYEVDEKVERWLGAGTVQVWIVNPRRRTIAVHTASGEQTLRNGDTLEGGELLPEFRLPLSEVFV